MLILLSFLPHFVIGQTQLPMSEVERRKELSMTEVTGKTSNGLYRYYAKGESQPFTGVLYAKYPNGQLSSCQEFVNGVGQGSWINYYENGNYKEVGTYEQNLVQGPIQKFHPNGRLQAEGRYKDWRIRVGTWKYYDEQGRLLKMEDYGEKGNIEEVKAYYERGEISYSWYAEIRAKNGF